MPKKIVGFKPEEVSGVDHPATLIEGWMVAKSKELGIKDEDLASIIATLEEAATLTEEHADLVKNFTITDSPFLKAAPDDIRAAAEVVSKYLSELGEEGDKSEEGASAGPVAELLQRMHNIQETLEVAATAVAGEEKEESMSEFNRDTLDDVAKAAFEDIEKQLADAIAKAEADAAASAAAVEELSSKITGLEAAATASAEAAAAAEAEAGTTEVEDEVLKSLPENVRKMLDDQKEAIEKANVRAEAAEKVAKAERDERLNKEYVGKAAAWTTLSVNADEFGPLYRELNERSPELAAEVARVLDGATEAVKQAGAFDEKGTSRSDTGASAMDKLEALAKSIATEKSIDFAVAFDAALNTDVGKDLYNDYLSEKMGV